MNTDATNSSSASPQDQGPQPGVDLTQDTDQSTTTEAQLDDDGNPLSPPDETEEVEHEGQKFRVPKAVKPLLMLQSDYTRKTQEVAEQRKALDSERETFTKSAQLQQVILAEAQEVVGLTYEIKQLEAIDLQALSQTDPQRAQAIFFRLNQLKGARDGKLGELQQKELQRQSMAERESVTRQEQAEAVLARDVEGWSPELQSKLRDFAMRPALGFKANELAKVEDARVVKLLHLAYVGEQAIAKLKAAGQQPVVVAKPAQTVGSAAPAAKNPDRMSTEEWMKHRAAQLQRNRKR